MDWQRNWPSLSQWVAICCLMSLSCLHLAKSFSENHWECFLVTGCHGPQLCRKLWLLPHALHCEWTSIWTSEVTQVIRRLSNTMTNNIKNEIKIIAMLNDYWSGSSLFRVSGHLLLPRVCNLTWCRKTKDCIWTALCNHPRPFKKSNFDWQWTVNICRPRHSASSTMSPPFIWSQPGWKLLKF